MKTYDFISHLKGKMKSGEDNRSEIWRIAADLSVYDAFYYCKTLQDIYDICAYSGMPLSVKRLISAEYVNWMNLTGNADMLGEKEPLPTASVVFSRDDEKHV